MSDETKNENPLEPKFDEGEQVVLWVSGPTSSPLVVQSRELKGELWIYKCLNQDDENNRPPVPLPERLLKKWEPPQGGIMVGGHPRRII